MCIWKVGELARPWGHAHSCGMTILSLISCLSCSCGPAEFVSLTDPTVTSDYLAWSAIAKGTVLVKLRKECSYTRSSQSVGGIRGYSFIWKRSAANQQRIVWAVCLFNVYCDSSVTFRTDVSYTFTFLPLRKHLLPKLPHRRKALSQSPPITGKSQKIAVFFFFLFL